MKTSRPAQQGDLPPLALYLHIPWCVRKCPYCDFNSHENQGALPEQEYVDAVTRDLHASLHQVQGRKLSSIFIGGGTPSLFSDKAIAAMLALFQDEIGFTSDIEITLEANPGTAEQSRFSGYRAAGVNRLSIGVQSFSDPLLEQLGRIHQSQDAINAVAMARAAGFDNINIDLMHGLPQQSLSMALSDLNQAITLAPEHLSWYQLTIEPNTRFYSQPPVLPEEEQLADILDYGTARLSEAGYHQYEISAYARDNRKSQHNLNYWQFGDYLGLGAGAHGKWSHWDDAQLLIHREHKTRQPTDYLKPLTAPKSHQQRILGKELRFEFMLNALRLVDGVSSELYSARTGAPIDSLMPEWQELQERQLMVKDPTRIATTDLGLRFLNDVQSHFLVD